MIAQLSAALAHVHSRRSARPGSDRPHAFTDVLPCMHPPATRRLTAARARACALAVVHRDLKSSNIFLRTLPSAASPTSPASHTSFVSGGGSSGGGQHHLLLGDFGVAKALESTKAMACTQCGTPYYLPPEVCNGAPYDVKADIWSLGVLSYEICAVRDLCSLF